MLHHGHNAYCFTKRKSKLFNYYNFIIVFGLYCVTGSITYTLQLWENVDCLSILRFYVTEHNKYNLVFPGLKVYGSTSRKILN